MTSTIQKELAQGNAYLQEFDLLNAEKSYRKTLKKMPKSAPALLSMTRLQLLKGDTERARFFAKRALPVEHTGEAQALLAACSLQEGDTEQAISILQKAYKKHPNHPLILINLGKSLYQQGEYLEAKELILKAKENGAVSEEIFFDLGIISEELGYPQEALKHFQDAIAENPKFLPAYLRIAAIKAISEQVTGAIKWLERAKEEMPELPQIREELYGYYFLQEQPKKALAEAVHIAQQRGCAADYLRIGNTCLFLDRMEEAYEAYKFATIVEPESPYAYINLGHWHRIQKQRDEAIDAYCTATEKDDTYHKPYLGLALTFMELDQNFAKARYFLLRAIEREGNDFDVLMHFAICSMELGQWEEAEQAALVAQKLCMSEEDYRKVEDCLEECQKNQTNSIDC